VSTNTKCGWDENLWPSWKRGNSRAQVEEYNHWHGQYSPKLVTAHVLSHHGDTFTCVKEGSYLDIEGYCRDIFISFEFPTAATDGSNGVVMETVHFDNPVSGNTSFYFENAPHPSKKAVLLQVCKNRSSDLAVHALLLENCDFGRHRRIGTAKLENYNLCCFLTTQSETGVRWVAHMHPREFDNRLDDRLVFDKTITHR
jgi:hypothetical protein